MKNSRFTLFCLLALGCASLTACQHNAPTTAAKSATAPVAAAAPKTVDASEGAIRFLEARVKKDPDDFIAQNKLADYYLLRLRETGALNWLELATRTAQASLKAMPAEQNTGGLTALTQAEFSAHNFTAARDHARQLIELDGGKGYPHQLLGDALLELGEYEAAEKSFRELERRARNNFATETRLARLAALRGDHARERQLYEAALARAQEQVPPARESLAWCHWQLGETAFHTGDYAAAEQQYRAALMVFPDYYRALGGLGHALAARGDVNGAIAQYERATKILPDLTFVAALGDLYQLAGRAKDADAQFALCEQLGRLSAAGSEPYNRVLALFYADHDLKPAEAYRLAQREYAARHDIYGADALAWTAFKAGQANEAQRAMKESLRLGTQDAKLFYHAGLIARAAGDQTASHDYLQRALKLNPQFDPRQAPLARQALDANAK